MGERSIWKEERGDLERWWREICFGVAMGREEGTGFLCFPHGREVVRSGGQRLAVLLYLSGAPVDDRREKGGGSGQGSGVMLSFRFTFLCGSIHRLRCADWIVVSCLVFCFIVFVFGFLPCDSVVVFTLICLHSLCFFLCVD